MDDLKAYAMNDEKLKKLLDIIKIFSDDIKMKFGLDKCAKAIFIKGKFTKTSIIIWQAPRAGSMRRILFSDWLPERARWSDTARAGLPVLFSQIKFRQSSSECTKVFSR